MKAREPSTVQCHTGPGFALCIADEIAIDPRLHLQTRKTRRVLKEGAKVVFIPLHLGL